MKKTHNLSDSQARWEAVNFIAAVVEDAIANGAINGHGESLGLDWTDTDEATIEQHALARVEGLLRRPRKF
jgi:hypothetical protein